MGYKNNQNAAGSSGLNQAQAEAAAHKDGPCMVLAGPGSGKTLTIAKRIEYLITKYKVRPEEILVITFTRYAAIEMRKRFYHIMEKDVASDAGTFPQRTPGGTAGNSVVFGTFHGIYYGILKWAYGPGRINLLSEGEKYDLIRQAASGMQWEELSGAEEAREYLQELTAEIGNVKNHCQNIEDYESARYGTDRFRELYQAYEIAKKKLGKIDFEDMLIQCRELFLQRPDILEKWQQKFRYILVDEFQDVNQAQYEVARMLAAPEDNLFVVGDDDQSIYGFRGAKPGIMKKFLEDYPQARQVLLNVNYRSESPIVYGALRVIGHNQERYEKEITAKKQTEETALYVQEVQDPVEEGRYVLGQIQEYAQNGVPYDQMAVLYRTNQDARTLTEMLCEYQVPFVMKESLNNIYDHFVGIDISSYFHLSQGHYDRKYFLQVANRPKRYFSRDSMREGQVSYESLRRFYCDKAWMIERIDQLEWDMKVIRDQTPYAAIQYIRKGMGYDGFLNEYARYRGIPVEELLGILDEIQQNSREFLTIGEWFAHVEHYKILLEKQKKESVEKKRAGGKTDEAGVSLQTIHGAKGLEYDRVFMIACNEGSIPYRRAQMKEELEEERRLFYVAMTRAKSRLHITYVKEKNGKDLNPSRFVEELLFPA